MPITEDRATGGNGNIVTVLLLAVVMLKARDHPTTVHLKRQPGTATPQDQILRVPGRNRRWRSDHEQYRTQTHPANARCPRRVVQSVNCTQTVNHRVVGSSLTRQAGTTREPLP
jgi:hypothetical protein